MLALLADRLGNLDVAHDGLQDAYAKAASVWAADAGVPDDPAAWVYVVARNAAIDRIRRDAAARNRLASQARVLDTAVAGDVDPGEEEPPSLIADEGLADEGLAGAGDEQLRLMLLCCHPALSRESQVVLTLRLAGGLTTEEIAAAFLLQESTVQQRIVRAKRKIREARIPLAMPAELPERAQLLATVLGLIFNEGYVAHSSDAATLTRSDLADQAIRLTATAADALPDEPELAGLLALELFHRSRERARTDASGRLIRLAEQDRSLWEASFIARGHAALAAALNHRRLGPWQMQALIAAEHTRRATDWERVVRYYDTLLGMSPGPVIRLSRAIAVGEAQGPEAALAEVEEIDGLDGYHLFHAARADLLERTGDPHGAVAAWDRAAALATNPAEVQYLRSRTRDVRPIPPRGVI
nr:sigma-70 family RNA polymerase sigma factor [Demequina flava]